MSKKEIFARVGNELSDKEREIVDKMKRILTPMGWSIRCDTRPHGLFMWLSHEDLLMGLGGDGCDCAQRGRELYDGVYRGASFQRDVVN